MTSRTIAGLWLVVGIVVWNGIFDLYVARGAREYLQLQAESEVGRVPQPSMADVMGRWKQTALIAATIWASVIVACGWITIRLVSKPRRDAGTAERH